jgi:membrane-associated protease RseP (regulator of RpoE activity)
MITLKSLKLLCVSLLLTLGAGGVFAQQTAPAAPPSPRAPRSAQAPEAPAAPFTFFFEGGSFLGVHTEDINKENMSRYGLQREPRGVGITNVVEGSPAERAGLREGDVILRFDNEAVTSVRKLNRLISEVAPEHAARLTISRGNDEKDLTVTLGKRSDFNAAYGVPGGQRWEDLDKLRDFKFNDKSFRPGDNNGESFSFVFGNNRRIGVATTQLTRQLADYFGIAGGKGLLITSVRDDSPAAKAGLRAGDVITEADGQPVGTVADLMRAISRKDEGEMTLNITRDKSQRTIRLTPERGKDSNLPSPGVYFTPQAMRVTIPRIAMPAMPSLPALAPMRTMPVVVVPATPKVLMPSLPQIRVTVPAKVMTLPSMPL